MSVSERNVPSVLVYGRKLLDMFPEIVLSRKHFTYNFDINHANPEQSNDSIMQFLIETLGFSEEDIKNCVIVHKNIKPEGLSYHIDDCQLIKYKRGTEPTYNLDQFILLESTGEKSTYLHFNTPTKKLPKFTILFYASTHGIDFEGGLLTLGDGTVISPKRCCGFMMDSREVHMVTRVTKGIRNVTVVKIY